MLPERELVTLIRKRYIPDEVNILKDDIILYYSDVMIITKWQVLKPRLDFTHGYSMYFLNEGYKISKFLTKKNELYYYYCDIIHTDVNMDKNEITFIDLILDVVIYENGSHKILDLDELRNAYAQNIIDKETLLMALGRFNNFLEILYSNKLQEIIQSINQHIE